MSSAPTESRDKLDSSGKPSTIGALRASYGSKAQADRADAFVSRYIYRPISFYLTVPFVWMGFTGNQVTVLRGVLALFAAALVAMPKQGWMLLGSLLYAFCVLLDYVDGNLARLQGTTGGVGAFLEEVVDQIGPSLFPLGVGIGLYLRPDRIMRFFGSIPPIWALFLGVLTSLTYCLGRMAALYVRLVPTNMSRAANPDTQHPAALVNGSVPELGRLISEGIYLAVVFGLVLTASLDVLSIYLGARALRNSAFLVVWTRRLAARISSA
jgi:phosphatidylglycerophosphate synthase